MIISQLYLVLIKCNLINRFMNISENAFNTRHICDCGPGAFAKVTNVEELKRFIIECMTTVGASDHNANIFAESLIEAESMGVKPYGVSRLAGYIQAIWDRTCDPKSEPEILEESASTALVCGHNGIGDVIGDYAMGLAMEKALPNGIGMVVANESNDFGMASRYSFKAAKKGYIGLSFTNTPPLMVPTNAMDVALGSNPLCIAAPGNCEYFILDMAATATSLQMIRKYKSLGHNIPRDWALNKCGKTETDPGVALEDLKLVPLGGEHSSYKGMGLAILTEVLSGLLAGSNYGPLIPGCKCPKCPNLGHGFIAINPQKFAPNFPSRLSDLLCRIRSMARVDFMKCIVIPGDKEISHMEQVTKQGGVILTTSMRERLDMLSKKLRVNPLTILE